MRSRTLPLAVLVAATLALVGSAAWAIARVGGTAGGWVAGGHHSGMMGSSESDGGRRIETLEDARRQAQRFADRLDLRVGEVMRFTNHFYAELVENDGRPATEVLVDPAGGAVFLEYGPAMMWNTRYGMTGVVDARSWGKMGGSMMGGMMGGSMMGSGMMGGLADPTWSPGATETRTTPLQARRIARRWLARQSSGFAAGEPKAFPGYYTLHVLRDRKVAGMLSVNAATGAVWAHWWHGQLVSMPEG
jgi:hypothetical protein